MIDSKSLNDLAAKITSLLPADLDTLKQDLEKNIRAGLQSGLQKLDLVSREEFDVQAAVLARTREKLEALEKRLQALEAGDRQTGNTKARQKPDENSDR